MTFLLSQYIGETIPLDHVNGSSGLSSTAFISRSISAILSFMTIRPRFPTFLLSSCISQQDPCLCNRPADHDVVGAEPVCSGRCDDTDLVILRVLLQSDAGCDRQEIPAAVRMDHFCFKR